MQSLHNRVEQLLHDNAPEFEIAQVIKKDIRSYFDTLPEIFSQTNGKDFLAKHTNKIDMVVKLVYKIVLRSMFGNYMPLKNSIPLSITALGSYGREQLCVHSDIDLMIVYEETEGYHTKECVEKILYMFWDIGLKLGHRVHEISELPEVARSDITIKSAILEARFIDGSKFLWTGIENKITIIRKENPEKFIREKLEEQRALHQKFPLTMEPNLKEGVGGFRDANLVFWIGKMLYNVPRIRELPSDIVDKSDYRQFRMALEFLFRVRSALHLVAGKKEDRLRLEFIPEVALMMGMGSGYESQTKLARKTTESLKLVNLFGKIWIEALIGKYVPDVYTDYLIFDTKDKQLQHLIKDLNTNANKAFKAHPRLLKALFNAQKPERLSSQLYKTIKDIFNQNSSYSILIALSQVRLLKYTIPPIQMVVDLPQFDGYHKYAVDIHLLQCLYHLENIDDPIIQEIYANLNKKEKNLIKIVVFLHDAGKGRKRNHNLVGASLFRLFATKLRLEQEYIELGERLIQYHDLMSITAQREDLYNEKTILQFASRFNTKRLLDLIYLLTYADMKGVGDRVYTNFSAGLIRTLYKEALESLKHEKILDTTARKLAKVESLKRSKIFMGLPKTLQKKILSVSSNEFFIRNSAQRIISITQMAIKVEDFEYTLCNKSFLTIEIIRQKSINLGYLLSKLSRLNIVNMEIVKLFDGLKYFKIDFSESIDESEIPLVEDIIHASFDTNSEITLTKPIIKKAEIEIDCNHSRDYAVMKLRTEDQKGLLAYITHLFDRLKIDIATAKIHTRKRKVNDLFLIQKDGNFCHNTELIIRELTE